MIWVAFRWLGVLVLRLYVGWGVGVGIWGILVKGSRGALEGGGGEWVGGDVGGILFGGLCISDNINVT